MNAWNIVFLFSKSSFYIIWSLFSYFFFWFSLIYMYFCNSAFSSFYWTTHTKNAECKYYLKSIWIIYQKRKKEKRKAHNVLRLFTPINLKGSFNFIKQVTQWPLGLHTQQDRAKWLSHIFILVFSSGTSKTRGQLGPILFLKKEFSVLDRCQIASP